MVIKRGNTWMPIKIDKKVEGIENLLAIEELTDYSLVQKDGISVISGPKKKKKPKKRKSDVPGEVAAKKVKYSKNVFTVTTVESEEHDESVSEFDSSLYVPWSNIFVPDVISKPLLEKGFQQPTEIQRLSIPAAIKGRRDILGAAETGSGKTLAFGIPIIYGILKNLEKIKTEDESSDLEQNLWALILTPTRELAVQIKDHLEVVTKYTSLKVAVIVGGMSSEKQSRILNQKPHIVVATPGRLWDLVQLGELHFRNIDTIKYLVIDETDRMLEANHFPELRSLLELINTNGEAKKLRQNFVFSATLTLVHQPPKHIVKKRWKKSMKSITLTPPQKLDSIIKLLGITNAKIVDITNKTGLASTLSEARILCNMEEKDFYLYYFLLVHPGRTLVFCNSIECVRRLASILNLLHVKALPLHSNMIQKQRLKNLERFSGGNGVLLATDVAARGLDIPATEHVIHYQVPRTSESYVHRSGRTARASRPGLTVLFVSPEEVPLYTRTLVTLNREKELEDFPIKDDVLMLCKERVKAARDLDILLLRKKRESDKKSWLEKAAQEADMIIDESIMLPAVDSRQDAIKRKTLKIAKKHLETLLNQPVASSRQSAVDKIKTIKNDKKIKIFKKKNKNNVNKI